MEPISAGIMAGGSLLTGLVSSLFNMSAADESLAAQQEAQMMNYQLAAQEMAEGTRRFNISNALENMRFRLLKENQAWTQAQQEEADQASQALGFSNRLIQLGNSANVRGQGLAGAWAAQAQLR